MEQDPIKKEEKKARLMRETIPFYLSKFEKMLSENNGFSVGSEVRKIFTKTSTRWQVKFSAIMIDWLVQGKIRIKYFISALRFYCDLLFQITWCDFVFAVSLENFEHIFGKAALDQYPALKALKIKVYSIPSISAWVARRPATES